MNHTEKMPVKELLRRLAADGVALFPDGADLRFRADHPIDDGTLETLKERKPEILRALDISQAVENFKRDGFIQIFSAYLGESIYLVRDEKAASEVPNKELPIYFVCELAPLRDLNLDELRTMHEVKKIFGGVIS